MIRKSELLAVYIKEARKPNGSPTKQIKKIAKMCDDMGVWSSRYYNERDRDMEKALNVRITREATKDTADGYQLRYIEYKGVTYRIANILNDRDKGVRYCILDLEELKK